MKYKQIKNNIEKLSKRKPLVSELQIGQAIRVIRDDLQDGKILIGDIGIIQSYDTGYCGVKIKDTTWFYATSSINSYLEPI